MTQQRLGDAPIEERYHQQMVAAALALDELFNGEDASPYGRGAKDERKVAFVLLVSDFGDKPGGRCNFVSNGVDRRDVVSLMKEMIARLEGQPEMTGHA
jgi:hypothetical protein